MAGGHDALPGGPTGVHFRREQACSLYSRFSLHLMLNTYKASMQGRGAWPWGPEDGSEGTCQLPEPVS